MDPFENELTNMIRMALLIAVSLVWSRFFDELLAYFPFPGLFGKMISAVLFTLISVIFLVTLKKR